MDAYKVGVSLALTGPIERQMAGLLRQMGEVDRAAQRVNDRFSKWGVNASAFAGLRNFDAQLKGLVGTAATTGAGIARGIGAGMGPALTEARAVQSAITGWGTAATTATGRIQAAAGAMTRAAAAATGMGGTGAPPGIRRRGGAPASPGGHIGEIAGGYLGLSVVKAMAHHAGDLSHELTQVKKLGIGAEQVTAVRRQAQQTTREVKGVTEQDALKVYGQTYSLVGHEQALGLIKPLTQFAEVSGNTSGNYKAAYDNMYSMLRAGELMGQFTDAVTHKVDIARLSAFLDLGARVTQATHGRVNSQTWLGLAQQGGPALSGMDEKGLLTMGMVSQVMGGHRAGTALTGMYQQLIGGRMTEFQAKNLKELGLVGDYDVGRGGRIMWKPDALKGEFSQTLKTDPLKAVEVMKRAMESHGISDIEQQVPKLFEILGRQTTQRIVHELLRNSGQLIEERERIAGGLGVGASKGLADSEDFKQSLHNLGASWTKFMTVLGNSEATIAIMNKLSRGLDFLTEKLRGTEPEKLQILGIGIMAIGGALAAAAGLALMAALGAGGWLVVGIGLWGTALAMLKPQFDSAVLAASGFVGELGKEILSWPNRIGEAIEQMGKAIVAKLKAMLASLLPSTGGEGTLGSPGYNPNAPIFGGSFSGGAGGGRLHNASFSNDNVAGGMGRGTAGVAGRTTAGLPGNTAGMNAAFVERLKRFNEAAKAEGHSLGITDGFRSYAQQVDVYRRKPHLAAKPGHSNHGHGIAADLRYSSPSANQWAIRNAHKFGLKFPMLGGRGRKNEPWHVEPVEGRGLNRGGGHAPPPPKHDQMVIHVHSHLDGQKVAQSVTKRQVASLNRPSHGGAEADYSATYPQVA
jgi:D-alanyl-D-alanine carboxypeptidase